MIYQDRVVTKVWKHAHIESFLYVIVPVSQVVIHSVQNKPKSR